MREEFNPLNKFCGTWTNPAVDTKSIGLHADARVVMVFASPSGQYYHDVTDLAHLSGQRHRDNFIVTRNPRPSIGTLPAFIKTTAFKAKTHANPDMDGNSLNHRAVRCHIPDN